MYEIINFLIDGVTLVSSVCNNARICILEAVSISLPLIINSSVLILARGESGLLELLFIWVPHFPKESQYDHSYVWFLLSS